jgi:hypothetical protein
MFSQFGRFTVSGCMAAAMLAGCGGSQTPVGLVPIGAAPDHLPGQKSFDYTGETQYFTVPAGVRQIKVIARGARGAGSPVAYGGRVHAVIPVTPGEKLVVYVGGDGMGHLGGYNGGGPGYRSTSSGNSHAYGGGGATDIREGGNSLDDRVLVAGGAGGQGGLDYSYGVGGQGGGRTAGSGAPGFYSPQAGAGGSGGAQKSGGRGGGGGTGSYGSGESGGDGSLGEGGGGAGPGGYLSYLGGGGGGGGGGYYGGGGGGGGGGDDYGGGVGGGGGGGGGSSFVQRSASDVRMWRGWKESADNGLVVFSW